MSTNVIDKLDRQIDAMLQTFGRQKLENKLLREKQAQLIAERDALQKKYVLATEGIKRLIEKLKLLER